MHQDLGNNRNTQYAAHYTQKPIVSRPPDWNSRCLWLKKDASCLGIHPSEKILILNTEGLQHSAEVQDTQMSCIPCHGQQLLQQFPPIGQGCIDTQSLTEDCFIHLGTCSLFEKFWIWLCPFYKLDRLEHPWGRLKVMRTCVYLQVH